MRISSCSHYLLRFNCILYSLFFLFGYENTSSTMKIVKLNATGEFNWYVCTLLFFFVLCVQLMLCLHV